MSGLVAVFVLGALLAVMVVRDVWLMRQWARERHHLVQAIVARHAPDLVALAAAETGVSLPKVEPRKATPERPGVDLDGRLIDEHGQVVDESAMIGKPGNS